MPRRIVLTGGPGAGKTAALELIRRSLCEHVSFVPEAAGILFGGGFPRGPEDRVRRAAQRAIFHVQCELEEVAAGEASALVLCDRGTVDGEAYWPGPDSLWPEVGTTRAEQLARYGAVLHMRTPDASTGYDRANPLRHESVLQAHALDERIARAWAGHPRRIEVPAATRFLDKVAAVLEQVRQELPDCCRNALVEARNITVEAEDGQVTLRGEVSSCVEKKAAGQAARAVPGASRVRNELHVRE